MISCESSNLLRYNTDVPLVLMNSFLTEEDTEKIIRKYSSFRVPIKTFTQSCNIYTTPIEQCAKRTENWGG